MANRILKRLAIAAGTGLAVGMNAGRPRTLREAPIPLPKPVTSDPAPPLTRAESGDDFLDLNIDPLLDRLEAIEAQIEMFERQAAASADRLRTVDEYAARLATLERRAEENAHALAALRESVNSAERNNAVRTDDLRERFRIEIQQSERRILSTFERTIDEKILANTTRLERSLAEHTGSIAALSVRASEADNSLQRLAMALEKLCERAQLLIPGTDSRPSHTLVSHSAPSEPRLPFETQLDDALRRDPVTPILRTKEPAEPTPPKKARLFSSAWWSPD
jgi:prefoldin subunit 5